MFSPLRVLIDARKISDGGIGVYTANLISGLLSQGGMELTLIGNPEQIAKYPWGNEIHVVEDDASLYSYDEMIRMPKRINVNQFDLFHCPHFTLPYGIRIPTVVTVHDLIHVRFPEKAYYPLLASMLIRSAVKRASRVITVSKATNRDLRRTLRLPKRYLRKVEVIPNAIDPDFVGFRGSADYVANKMGITGPYFLTVMSMVKPHKGLCDLLDAYSAMKKAGEGRETKLVLAGKGTEELVRGERLLDRAAATKGVHILGSVSKEDLLQLYSNARAVVVPSLAEGFCLPVLEAQAVGTPVVARPVSAILELLTDRDYACESFSVDSLTTAMKMATSACTATRPTLSEIRARMLSFDRDVLGQKVQQIYLEATGRVPVNSYLKRESSPVSLQSQWGWNQHKVSRVGNTGKR